MACSIVVTSVLGILPASGQPPSQIEVSGQAQECKTIILEGVFEGVQAVAMEVPVEDTGDWQGTLTAGVHFPSGAIFCGTQGIKITATCKEDPDCKDDVGFDSLPCRSADTDCPTVSLSVGSIAATCDSQNRRTVTLKAVISGAPSPTVYEWDFGDGTNSSSDVFTTSQVEITHAFAAPGPGDSVYTVTFRIVLPQGCAEATLTVEVPPCETEPCADQITLAVEDSAGNSVNWETATCVAPGTYTITVTAPTGTGYEYTWSKNGQLLSSGASPSLDVAVEFGSNNVAVSASRGDCTIPGLVQMTGCGTCPDFMKIAVFREGEAINPASEDCFPPGEFRFVAVLPFGYENSEFSWRVNNDPQVVTGNEFTTSLSPGEHIITFATHPPGCPIVTGQVSLTICDPCDRRLDLEVEDATGQVVNLDDQDCLPPGRYTIRVVELGASNLAVAWQVNGVAAAGTGPELTHTLEEGAPVDITATVKIEDCEIEETVTLEPCPCPDNIGITVMDSAGNPVPVNECVEPGNYQFEGSGDNLEDAETQWTVGGNPEGNGTVQNVEVTAPVVFCGGDVSGTTVNFTVTQEGCRTRQRSVTLNVCSRYVMKICCEIMDFLILVLAGLTLISLALMLCPLILVVPWAVALAAANAWWIFLLLLALLIVMVLIWYFLCPPDWCFDVAPLIWQITFIAAVVFLYFGDCPLCLHWMQALGVILLLLWGVMLFWWVVDCRPSRCLVIWELLKLGFAQTLLSLIETIIGLFPLFAGMTACITLFAPLFLWIITLALDFLLLMLPAACGFNPRGRSGA